MENEDRNLKKDTMKRSSTYLMGILEIKERENKAEAMLEEIMAENLLKLTRDIKLWFLEAPGTLRYINRKKTTPRCITVKLMTIKDS